MKIASWFFHVFNHAIRAKIMRFLMLLLLTSIFSIPLYAVPARRSTGATSLASAATLAVTADTSGGANVSAISGKFGSPGTFAPNTQLASYGFAWGPSDGQFGAIPTDGTGYRFYGSAGTTASCAGAPNAPGEFLFFGTLDHVTGSNCARVFGPGDGPTGWIFDKNYAGGGEVVPFAVNTTK